MRIKITKGGIFGAKGEIEIGTEIDLDQEPTGWAGRYEVISSGGKGKTLVTNPAEPQDLKAVHHGGGKFNIVDGDEVLVAGLTKADADAFNGLSDEDKKAYVDANKQG
ncbi:hypothetical protein [Kaistia sp. UC242_56]|uniref:hypothetical protein n=1 Tax=Kaistia sp. UC242_56 TaxID=3374625 RepID=UPI0037937801